MSDLMDNVVDPEETAAFAHFPVPPDETVRYGGHPDQVIDYYRASEVDAPVVVLLHGGFWKQRYDRSHLTPMAAALAEAGFTTALAEYRRVLGGDGGWPRTFDDVAAAVDLVIDRAGERPVFVVGHSAGGHLALWTAARHQLPPNAPGYREAPLPLRMIVPIAGVSDLVAQLDTVSAHPAIVELLGGVEAVPANLAYADPLTLLGMHGPTGIPTVLVHGVDDREVSVEQSRAYAGQDSTATLRALDGVGHYAPIDPDTDAYAVIVDLLRETQEG